MSTKKIQMDTKTIKKFINAILNDKISINPQITIQQTILNILQGNPNEILKEDKPIKKVIYSNNIQKRQL